ncbi:Multidrug resistance-associated protein 5 [Armadillidium nasatum]|uniref:Multidrug resistance-associated protein 5 n=1 Tax=Armadillidium nasatum TaxID=96803 RepID=A0A5N5SWH5_9CRUS|nr:Multidrug resistance-associated protein 5 [Armadillidium nasatum]
MQNIKVGCCHKYSNALKILLPFRLPRKDKSKLPGNKSGLISYFSLTWLTKLMWKAFRRGLQPDDLWDLQDEDCAAYSCARINRLWGEEQNEALRKENEPRLWKAVWRASRTRIIVTIFISFIMNLLQFLGPSILLKLTLDYINKPEIDHLYGTYIIVGIFLVNVVRGASFNLMFVIGTHTATRVTGGIQSMVYRKVLKLKTGGEKLSAQLTNILTNDMERLFEAVISSVFLTASPAFFIMSAVYCVFIIGPWALIGMACYLLFYPVMGGIAKAQSRVRVKTVKKTDKRVALMNEILNSLSLIKMYAWEESFAKKIAAIRLEEMKRHRMGALLQAVSSTMVPSISILATICTLLGYTLAGLPLKSAEAFTIYSVFNAMQFTVGVLPFTIRSIAEAKISLSRIQKLLALPEHKKQMSGLVNNQLSLFIKNGTFAWEVHSIDLKGKYSTPVKESPKSEKKSEPSGDVNGTVIHDVDNVEEKDQNSPLILSSPNSEHVSPTKSLTNSVGNKSDISQNHCKPPPLRRTFSEDGSVELYETLLGINLSIERGKLVGICGSIGSGKSSLVSAICGDMKLCSGQLQVNGRLALVTQQAWIYNATLRENILIGQPYDEERYLNVIEACSLVSDIKQMGNGDLTEIGEKGINLSGGQKQRVNLARALYSNRDIYLLDDPLSAVDTKVAKHLFNRCIKEAMAEKTVLLISHGTHFLEKCDEVIFMKEGRICERGTHAALMMRQGDYFELMSYNAAHEDDSSPDEIEVKRKRRESERSTATENMIEYRKEVKEVCGGWCICMLIFLAIVLFTLCRIFNVVWLQRWLDDGDGLEKERKQNRTLYNITYSDDELKGDVTQNPNLWIYQLVYGLSFVFLIAIGIVKGIGVTFRVLAGSSKLHQDMFNSIINSPMRFLDTTPTGRILNRFSRDLDEVDVRIPFFLEFVLQGMLAVLAQIIMVCAIFPLFTIPFIIIMGIFIWMDFFLNSGVRELKRLDNNLKSPVIQHLTASISGLSVIRTFDREKIFIQRFNTHLDNHSVALLVFRLSNRWFTYRMDLMATIVTFAISVICVFTKGHFSTAMAGLALATVNGVCGFIPFLMRMKSEFQSRLTSVERIIEYAYEIESEAPKEIEATKPPPSWPSEGGIIMEDVKLRYRPELPLVLHGITATIKPSEKIGIIGRTGAGKSSLISTLLRMVELESGTIKIDGIDISVIGLHTLRSSISVIPQDPVLFKGTIRYNLDPFDDHSDEAVWTALERAHLKTAVNKLTLKLQSEVEAAGENFSVLLLDEATASVDVETDHLIQDTIRDAFANCTVLTIAHRLNTIAAYDRVMVLDAGKVKEFDTPINLMQNENSMFKEMMAAMGIRNLAQMTALI